MNEQSEPEKDASHAADALALLLQRARVKAAAWRGAGVAQGLEIPVHPPAQSALLATYLTSYLHRPIEIPPAPKSLPRRLLHRILGAERARVDRLMEYANLLTEDLSSTICRLEVEVAELRARVGLIEDTSSSASSQSHRS